MIKKICSVLLIIMLLLNSSALTVVSTAVDEVEELVETLTTGTEEKISLELGYTQLTNRVQNELVITGILEKDTEDCALYENPTVYFVLPEQVEKVVINDIKVLYDDELELGEYSVETNEAGNQVIKVSLVGEQTKYQTDDITKGTNIRIVANIILKQDMETATTKITMSCGTAVCEQEIKVVNTSEIEIFNEDEDLEGTTVYANGLLITTRATVGDEALEDGDVLYTGEIVKYQVQVVNATDTAIENVDILGNIPEGMIYVEYDEEAFSYWSETYTFLTDSEETNVDGDVLYQDDSLQYVEDESVKTKTIEVGTLESGEKKTYYYEAKVTATEETEIETTIDTTIDDEVVSTYSINNIAQNGAFEVRIRTYISRTEKNTYSYHFFINNISDESQDAKLTINVPSSLQIESVNRLLTTDSEIEYTLENGVFTLEYENIEAGGYRAFEIEASVLNVGVDEQYTYTISLVAKVEDSNGNIYVSNESKAQGGIEAINITQSSETNGETLNGNDEVTYVFQVDNVGYVREEEGGYTTFMFAASLPKDLEITSITYNTNKVEISTVDSQKVYTITPINKYFTAEDLAEINSDDYCADYTDNLIGWEMYLKTGESSTITITAKVKSLVGQEDDKTIETQAIVYGDNIETKLSNIITNTLHNIEEQTIIVNPEDQETDVTTEPTTSGETTETEPTTTDTTTTENTSTATTETKRVYTLSGTAWIDENENGKKDDGETLKSGVEVSLFDVVNNTFLKDDDGNIIKQTTGEDGKYSFTKVTEGSYYVIFEYDTDEYYITDYQKTGVVETINNDAIEKVAKMPDGQKTIGITNTIKLTSSTTNIDIGLIENKIFDLQVEQYIEKITVTNDAGSKEYTYNNKKFAKFEINSEYFVGSTVVIEYKIVITNVGELAGTVYEIIDQMSTSLDFHSELNSGWSKSAYKLSNISYAGTEIGVGESIEATVVLSKTLEDDSAGTYENIASIGISDNSRHVADSNSENDSDTTTVIIGVSTGIKVAIQIIFTIIGLAVVIELMYIAIRKMPKRARNVMMVVFMVGMISATVYKPLVSNANILDDIADGFEKIDDAISDALGYGNGGSGEGDGLDVSDEDLPSSGADYDTTGMTQEEIDALYAKADQDFLNDLLASSGIDIQITGDFSNPADVKAAYEEAVVGWYAEEYGIDTSGCTSISEAKAVYEEARNDAIASLLESNSTFGSSNLTEEMLANCDLNVLSNMIDQMETIQAMYPETQQIHGVNGYIGDDGKYHFEYFEDAYGNKVYQCGDPGYYASSVYLNYNQSVSEISYTVQSDGSYVLTAHYEYEAEGGQCTRECQTMIADVELSGSGSTAQPPEYDESNPPTAVETPEEPDEPYTPSSSGARILIVKLDVDTEEVLTEGFRFRVQETGLEFNAGEEIELPRGATYHIEEIETPFGYDIYREDGTLRTFEIYVNDYLVYTEIQLRNELTRLKLSGYVWEDMLDGKSNQRDNVYTDDVDLRLEGIKVMLYNDGELVGTTWTDENGEYSFGGRNDDLSYTEDTILIEDLLAGKYHVEFEYNGIKYSNVIASTSLENGSKAIEGTTIRTDFNKKFTVITSDGTSMTSSGYTSGGYALNESGTVSATDITYQRTGNYSSSVIYGDSSIYDGTSFVASEGFSDYEAYGFDKYHITSSTEVEDFRYALEDLFEYDLDNEVYQTKEITNINLGVYAREQVDLGLDSDVSTFELNINGYNHVYTYGTLIDAITEEQMEVKLKAIEENYYERPLHEASVVYSANDGTTGANGDIYADITYKIYLQNKSTTLSADINEITLNYDSTLRCISYNYQGESAVGVVETSEGSNGIKELTLDLTQLGSNTISNQSRTVLEVTFRIDANVIAEILNDAVALKTGDTEVKGIKFDFMAEIKSYTTYDSDGNIYASIDKNSAARNARVETDENNRFITDSFENDTTISPTFILTKGSQTVLTGTVYEDSPEEDRLSANERVGDGIYDSTTEYGIANVKVELLIVPTDANGNYDSSDARDDETLQQEYEVAKLYKTDNSGNNVEIGDAVTYTDENGNYEFEGVIADNYVIRYTYGENISGEGKTSTIKTSDGDVEIKAREYKSTIITSDYIRKAINTSTDGIPHLNGDWTEGDTSVSWFLNNYTETRYSDAVDDVEYRAALEENAVLNNDNINDSSKYAYSEMEAYTAYFALGIEEFNDQNIAATLVTQEQGTIDYEYNITNIDFGLIERPIVDLQVDKQITNLKVTLANGQIPINGDPSDSSSDLPYVRTGLDDYVPIELDTELMEGATLEEEYTISITNNSEVDYPIYKITSDTDVASCRNYYYYGTTEGVSEDYTPVTVRVDVLGDYLTAELTVDLDELRSNGWEIVELEDLLQYQSDDGNTYKLIESDVESALEDGEYTIFITDSFADQNDLLVRLGETQEITYTVSRLLTSTDEMIYTNDVEILQYIGYSQNKDRDEADRYDRQNDTTPGNLIPLKASEDDEDSVRTTITPPTGASISKTLYIITALGGLVVIVIAVIFIKKRVIKA